MPGLKSGKKVVGFAWVCIVFFAFAFFMMAYPDSALAGQAYFSDLPQNDQIYPFVNYLAAKNFVSGYPDGSFRPAGFITRAEMAALLARASGLTGQKPDNPTFRDVGQDLWAYESIEAAVRAGLVKGDPDGAFRPDDPVSRAETAALLLRLTSQALPAVSLPDAVRDVSPAHWARNPISVSLDAGLLTMTAANSFAPDSPATRGQVARGLAVMLNISPERKEVPLTGTLVLITGEVTLQEPGQEPRKIDKDTAFNTGVTIKTGPNGKAELRYSDGSGLRLEENTELTIKKARGRSTILRDGSPGAVVDFLEVDLPRGKVFGALATTYFHGQENKVAQANTASSEIAGAFRKYKLLAYASSGTPGELLLTEAGEGSDNSEWWNEAYEEKVRVQVDMPWSVAGIRGTFWLNEVSGDRQVTNVMHGSAQVTAGGQTVTVSEGNSTAVTSSGGPPTPPAGMSNEEQRDWTQVRDWVSERANTIQNLAPVITPPAPVTEQTAPGTPALPPVPPIANEILNSFNRTTNPTTSHPTPPGPGGHSDTTPPTVSSADPDNNATDIPVGSSITVTFSENVQEGGNYGSINLKDGLGDVTALNKSISGNTLTITPGYALNSSTPVPLSGNIIVNFDLTLAAASNVDILLTTSGEADRHLTGTASSTSLTAAYSNLTPGKIYTVTIPAGSVSSSLYGTTNDPVSWSFSAQAAK